MPKKRQVRKYLKRHGWELWKETDHEYYRKRLPDGTYITTRLSHGEGEIPAPVWHLILKQLHITQDEFNRE